MFDGSEQSVVSVSYLLRTLPLTLHVTVSSRYAVNKLGLDREFCCCVSFAVGFEFLYSSVSLKKKRLRKWRENSCAKNASNCFASKPN